MSANSLATVPKALPVPLLRSTFQIIHPALGILYNIAVVGVGLAQHSLFLPLLIFSSSVDMVLDVQIEITQHPSTRMVL